MLLFELLNIGSLSQDNSSSLADEIAMLFF